MTNANPTPSNGGQAGALDCYHDGAAAHRVTVTEFKNLCVIPCLPERLGVPDQGAEFFLRLVGATILQIGSTDEAKFEGGGLIIDYQPQAMGPRRLVLAFNELGMWVEFEGALDKPDHLNPASNRDVFPK